MENMKCPHRIINKVKHIPNNSTLILDIENNTKIKGITLMNEYQEFGDCLKEKCMAYRKHRRTEICQKFPMGYYKDILD